MLFDFVLVLFALLLALVLAIGAINMYYFMDLIIQSENRERLYPVWVLLLTSIAMHAFYYIADMASGHYPPLQVLDLLSLSMATLAMGLLAKNTLSVYTFVETKRRLEAGVQKRTTELETTRSRLEASHRELKAAYDELKGLDRMKGDILSNVSHELKTPLTSIKCVLDLISNEGQSNERNELIYIAKHNADRLHILIEDLLYYAKMEYGTEDLTMEELDLGMVIATSVKVISHMALENNVSIDTKAQDDLRAVADKKALYKVFTHLLSNAIKFNKDGGKITVLARGDGNGRIEVCVEDTGIGIAREHLNKIFERFYQVDGSTKRKYPGTGLGLSIVKSIVEKHGGSIRVESEPDKGSRFTFEIPRGERNYRTVETNTIERSLENPLKSKAGYGVLKGGWHLSARGAADSKKAD